MKTTDPTHPVRQRSLKREQQALALRAQRLSYAQIGIALGISKTRAHKLVALALGKETAERDKLADTTRSLELISLDRMESALREQIEKGSTDHIHAALRIKERRAKLLGLDAPTRIDGHFGSDEKFLTREMMAQKVKEGLESHLRRKSLLPSGPPSPPSVHDRFNAMHDETVGKITQSPYVRHRSIQGVRS